AKALIDGAGPIAAPSANISTMPSITDSKDAIRFLTGRVDAIIDAGKTNFGIESTILNLNTNPIELLRAGSYEVEELEKFFGRIIISDIARGFGQAEIAITPGMKYRHYSPKKKLYLAASRESFIEMVKVMPENFIALCTDETLQYVKGKSIILGRESSPYEIASNLFSAFMKLDDSDGKYGIIVPFPENGIGLAIMNRIRKASYRTIKNIEQADL
ncbi:MAG: L-threonylcarbamoyladenylate synthase, partial [Thermoplasmata archaeon]